MKTGDIVLGWYTEGVPGEEEKMGIIIEVINSDYQVPPVCKVLWSWGSVEKEWTDELENISESWRSC